MDGRMWKNVKDKSVVKNLKAITSFEELEKVLKYIQNMQSENIRTLVSEQFDMLPRLKSTNESGGPLISYCECDVFEMASFILFHMVSCL